MKIFVTGTRGIPHIPGGVESHCENLYPIISKLGHDVTLARRSTYVKDSLKNWNGVDLVDIYAPKSKSVEAIFHTFLAVLSAKKHNAEILHIHAIGPSIMAPIARLLGLTVIVTNHGPDYDRQKWSWPAKQILRFGEFCGCKYANKVIVISKVIEKIVQDRCHRETNLVYNGVKLVPKSRNSDYLMKMGIRPGKYILAASRFVPEKGLHDLIEAFSKTTMDCQLVIAGDADHENKYSRKLKALANNDKRIVMTGYVTNNKLHQIFSHARLFVLPSYHEGLPIALLEALGYDLPVLVSDIPANIEVRLRPDRYYKCGDINDLRNKLETLIDNDIDPIEKKETKEMLETQYNWNKIAQQTVEIYEKAK